MEKLVSPREAPFDESAAAAADQAIGLARNIEALFDRRVQIDLSGGRDSRLSAAAAHAAGIEHRLRTGDTAPGEVAMAKRLVETAPAACVTGSAIPSGAGPATSFASASATCI